MATYQQALNKVMVMLRELTVTDLSDEYTLLVGEWMNTIKEEIEDSWDWQAGRQSVSFSSVVGQREYELGIDPRSRLLMEKPENERAMMFDVTEAASDQGFRLIRVPDDRRRRQSLQFAGQTVDKPYHFSLYKSATTLNLAFVESPEGVRDYTGVFYVPAPELATPTTEFHIPMRALVLGTLWMAAQERGEELGMDSNTLFRMYQNRLAKDIAMDMDETDALMVPV